jgi:hypothetical protein
MSGDDVRDLFAGYLGHDGIDAALGGEPLEAIELLTSDEDGWPHVAWLSPGEVAPVGPGSLGLCLWSNSTTTRNLGRDGRALLQAVVEGEVHKLRLSVRPLGPVDVDGTTLAGFICEVAGRKRDAVPYADVLAGPAYRLNDAPSVAERWHAQLRALESRLADEVPPANDDGSAEGRGAGPR